jgi:hypothetical protein
MIVGVFIVVCALAIAVVGCEMVDPKKDLSNPRPRTQTNNDG